MTKIEILKSMPQKVGYEDGRNVIQDGNGQMYLLAQVDTKKAVIFLLRDGMEWNRRSDPVIVPNWETLTVLDVERMFNLYGPVTRVKSTITIKIDGE